MQAEYKENGTIELSFDTVEDIIILKHVLGNDPQRPQPITFHPKPETFMSSRPKFAAGHSLAVGGAFSAEQLKQIFGFMRDKQHLAAVKLIKETTGWGLKESKEYYDSIRLT